MRKIGTKPSSVSPGYRKFLSRPRLRKNPCRWSCGQPLPRCPCKGSSISKRKRTRLAKEIAKLKGDADKIETKLRNADFVARAPEDVVEENRERREDALSRMEKLAAALAKLGGA